MPFIVTDEERTALIAVHPAEVWAQLSKSAAVRLFDQVLPGLNASKAAEMLGELGVGVKANNVRGIRSRPLGGRHKGGDGESQSEEPGAQVFDIARRTAR